MSRIGNERRFDHETLNIMLVLVLVLVLVIVLVIVLVLVLVFIVFIFRFIRGDFIIKFINCTTLTYFPNYVKVNLCQVESI